MRELNEDNIIEEVEFINKVLRSKKRGFKRIALEDYNLTDTELMDHLKDLGYVKTKNVIYRDIDITTSSMEVIEPCRQDTEVIMSDNGIIVGDESKETSLINIDTNKLNLLLDNLDSILKLIPKHNNTIWRTNDNQTRSIRLDTGLYEEIKHRAEEKGITITELFNRAVEEYLNKYN